ncbi:MAG: uroporphyrinogen decarboxylase [Thioalkalivibrionaceae bacterium]
MDTGARSVAEAGEASTRSSSSHRLIRALLREPVDRTPIWIMRQAGRYLPEYRETRARAGSFLQLAQNPELACEVTLQPLARFPLDAAILFSDILTVPDAMGLGLFFEAGEGPRFERPLRDAAAIEALPRIDPEQELRYVMDAVRLIRRELEGRVPLIGFSGSPWTLATYMVEGGGSKDFARVKRLMYAEPQTMHRLLQKLADAVADYLNAQIAAGAEAVMLFDTWGGVLSPRHYRAFSRDYLARVVEQLERRRDGQRIPVVSFTKNGGPWLEAQLEIGADALGLDWTQDPSEAVRRVDGRVALQGNLDPSVLYADPETVQREARRTLDGFRGAAGHVFNLGHGIHPGVDPACVAALVEAVQGYAVGGET